MRQKGKITCHYFDELTLEFLFSRDVMPECDKDFCDECGECLVCGKNKCRKGYNHYWVQYVSDNI